MARQEGRGEDWHQMGLSGMRWLLKRWWFWAVAGFVLVAVMAGYLLIPFEEARISQAKCDRIQLGMNPEQVDGLLGGQPWTVVNSEWRTLFDAGQRAPTYAWTFIDEDDRTITVNFNDSRRVTAKHFSPSQLSFFELMKRRIERRVRALWP